MVAHDTNPQLNTSVDYNGVSVHHTLRDKKIGDDLNGYSSGNINEKKSHVKPY